MPRKAVGRAAVELPWLCPNTDGLVGLAERPDELARLSAADPALLLFLTRFGPADRPFALQTDRFLAPLLPEAAAAYLAATSAGRLDPASPFVNRLCAFAQAAGTLARRIAEQTGQASPDEADVAARLSPLGWYAVAAVDAPPLVDTGLLDSATQVREWGLDHNAIARRLAARWRLPRWLAPLSGSLTLPFRVGGAVGTDPDLFAVVQLAVSEVEARSFDLGLTRGADRAEVRQHLRLDQIPDEWCDTPTPSVPAGELDQNPHHVPLLRNLLTSAANARRRNGVALVARLEDRHDDLHRMLADVARFTGDRLRDAKLSALAELAAGAGHEINNPLAVIAGNAQRLLRTEEDADRADTLRMTLRQTQRIASILRELLQFARPSKPEPQRVAASEIVAAVRDEVAAVAAERRVSVQGSAPADVWLDADPRQLRQAVAAVVRNGIEAAEPDGWVRVEVAAGDAVAFVVEDSGPGLAPDAIEHAFDPFFCGRAAGRGRGLGLPAAWRLARENGGDVRHDPVSDSPTRFVVTVPRAAGADLPERKSA